MYIVHTFHNKMGNSKHGRLPHKPTHRQRGYAKQISIPSSNGLQGLTLKDKMAFITKLARSAFLTSPAHTWNLLGTPKGMVSR